MPTSGLAAQAHGTGDGAECPAVLSRALIVGAVAGLGQGWGVRGVAVATLIADWAGPALALWLAGRR